MSLLNKAAVKKFALEFGKEKYKNLPAYMPTRVSATFINDLEGVVASYIREKIRSRPSKGVTL